MWIDVLVLTKYELCLPGVAKSSRRSRLSPPKAVAPEVEVVFMVVSPCTTEA